MYSLIRFNPFSQFIKLILKKRKKLKKLHGVNRFVKLNKAKRIVKFYQYVLLHTFYPLYFYFT